MVGTMKVVLTKTHVVVILALLFLLITIAMVASTTCQNMELTAVNSVLLAFAALLFTLQLCRAHIVSSTLPPHKTEHFAADAVLPATNNAGSATNDAGSSGAEGSTVNETVPLATESPMVAALTMYTSCFSKDSYSNVETSGRTWKSIRSSSSGGILQQSCADGSTRSMDLQFKNTPSFSRKDGFALGQNMLTGPLSYLMGINGDMAFSVMSMLQFTSDLPETADACLFKLFANTVNNNGASLILKKGTHVSNMIACECFLKLGNNISIQGKMNNSANILLQPRRPYLLTVVKDYGRVQMHLIDLGATTFAKTVLADTNVGSHEPIIFSNMDMTINDKANLNANIMTFSVFSRALTDGDMTDWYKHYAEILKQFDVAYVQMTQTLQQAQQATTCSFDEITCSACSGVKDWSNISEVLASSTTCQTAYDAYCTANPTKPRCECWNLNNPAYATTCASLRAAFSGQSPPSAPLSEEKPPVVEAPAPVPSPAATCPLPPSTLDSAQLIKSIVTPENIVAIGKAISEIQGHNKKHKKQCCCTQCKNKHPDVCTTTTSLHHKPSDLELLSEGVDTAPSQPPPTREEEEMMLQEASEPKKTFFQRVFGL